MVPLMSRSTVYGKSAAMIVFVSLLGWAQALVDCDKFVIIAH